MNAECYSPFMLILTAGLPGTGKSTLSRALATEFGGTVLDKDQIRAALFPAADIEYSTQQDDFCMAIMLKVAGYLFRKEPARRIFLDGRTFSSAYQLKRATGYADQRLASDHCPRDCSAPIPRRSALR